MTSFDIDYSYMSLDKAGALMGVSPENLIHAGAFGQVQICVNIYSRSKGYQLHRLDLPTEADELEIDEDSRVEAEAHNKKFFDWMNRLQINVMPAGIFEVGQEDLRLFEMPEIKKLELGDAYKSNQDGLWEVEFDPFIEIERSDLVILTTEIARIKKNGGISKDLDKPLKTRERNNLLTIIAVLCEEAGLDRSKHAKTALLIQSAADAMGISIAESTIESHLKKIPDALAGRMK